MIWWWSDVNDIFSKFYRNLDNKKWKFVTFPFQGVLLLFSIDRQYDRIDSNFDEAWKLLKSLKAKKSGFFCVCVYSIHWNELISI